MSLLIIYQRSEPRKFVDCQSESNAPITSAVPACRKAVLADNTHFSVFVIFLKRLPFCHHKLQVSFSELGCYDRTKLVWPHWVTAGTLAKVSISQTPIRDKSCRVTGGAFVTLILCHLGCSPLWHSFSPSTAAFYLYFSAPCLSFSLWPIHHSLSFSL